MQILTWLFRRAPNERTPAPAITIPESLPPRPAPTDDYQDDEFELATIDDEIQLEEIYCTIDYRAADGIETRRRITLLSVAPGAKGSLLHAVCHERQALRKFRCDRIICFIDMDGVVEEAEDFFRDTLYIDLASGRRSYTDSKEKIADFKEYLRPALAVMVLAAKSDDEFHAEELDIICQYIEAEALTKQAENFDIGLDELNAMTSIIRRMRPQARMLPEHVSRIGRFSDERYKRFRKFLSLLIMADGRITPEEEDFLREFDQLQSGEAILQE